MEGRTSVYSGGEAVGMTSVSDDGSSGAAFGGPNCIGVASGGPSSSGAASGGSSCGTTTSIRGLTKKPSSVNLLCGLYDDIAATRGLDDEGVAGGGHARSPPNNSNISVARVGALRDTVNKHCESIYKSLLSSKESLEKRTTVESAFRVCRDAFLEVSSALMGFLNGEASRGSTINADSIKNIMVDVLTNFGNEETPKRYADVCAGSVGNRSDARSPVARSNDSRVQVSRGPTVELTSSTSFLVVPDESTSASSKITSSVTTREILCKALKPSECGLRVERISLAGNNGVRVTARSPDIARIKSHPGLAKVGLKICENVKTQPRLIVHSIPVDMDGMEIKEEIIAQNLSGVKSNDVKVVYIFPPKPNRRTTSCILEVSPVIRKAFFTNGRIYLRFSACTFSDHVRVLQCFKCLAFGHLARECKSGAACDHCAGAHETRDCKSKNLPTKCHNCVKLCGAKEPDTGHSALDAVKCPILSRRIKDRISNTNYG